MNVLEMRLRFDELIKEASSGYPDRATFIDSTTILKYLNEAQIKYIQESYLSSPSFYERTRIIGNRLNDLRNLIYTISLDNETINTNYDNTSTFRSSTVDVWHYINVSGTLSRIYPYTTSNTLIDLVAIEAGDVNKYLTTSINKPIILTPVFTQTHSDNVGTDNQLSVVVIYDSYTTFTTDTLITQCLVKPKKLVFGSSSSEETTVCELAEYLHNEIVKLAVNLYDQDKYKLSKKEA